MTVASSEAEIITLKMGWKRTRVTGARCPVNAYFSGGRGIHSLGVRFSRVGAPEMYSFSASVNFASSSFTYQGREGNLQQNAWLGKLRLTSSIIIINMRFVSAVQFFISSVLYTERE